MKLLVVEDEDTLAQFIVRSLRTSGHVVELCQDGNDVINLINNNHYDIVILDVILPGKSGLEICKELRSAGNNISVIILSSLDSHQDRIGGLDSGADDYLIKPFHVDELKSRLEALKRRSGKTPKSNIVYKELTIDVANKAVYLKDEQIDLRPKEYEVLVYLVMKKGDIVSREELLNEVWSGTKSSNTSNRIDVCIRNIRKKIILYLGKDLIYTKHKNGYYVKN